MAFLYNPQLFGIILQVMGVGGLFEAAAGDLSDITTSGTTILTWLITSIGSVVSMIVGTPIFYLPILVGMVSLAVSFFLRLTWRG